MEFVLRFVIGGLVISAFAILGDVLRPKSFAGLFSAAPSVALATLSFTVLKDGSRYAALEARSMILGAAAFAIYAYFTVKIMMRGRWPALPVTLVLLFVWFGCALLMRYLFLG
jgi:hypothetical protein